MNYHRYLVSFRFTNGNSGLFVFQTEGEADEWIDFNEDWARDIRLVGEYRTRHGDMLHIPLGV